MSFFGPDENALLPRLLGRRYPATAVRWARLRHSRLLGRGAKARLGRAFTRRYGLRVRRGPFAGMEYVPADASLVDQLVPKLLGTYEREVAQTVRHGS